MPLIHQPFHRVAVVNRGEAAVRFLRAARAWSARRREPLEVVALHTTPDRAAMFVREADDAIGLGDALVPGPGGKLASAYLDVERVLRLVLDAGCDAVWPGWGFLAERPDFAEECTARGLVFIGPPAEAMRRLGDKIAGKRLAAADGVPVTPWSEGAVADAADAARHAARIGYPVLLKATAGGGGRGIRLVNEERDLAAAFESAANEARAAFGDSSLFVEAFAPEARHVEVQILADAHGRVHAVGTRDCSLQRRHQKVIEEAPAPGLGELESRIEDAAVAIARASGYVNAGTAEFLVLPDLSAFYFLEMNTRLQVEHPVTECVTGLDLVGLQIDVARGEALPEKLPETRGHAIEARLNAEDPDDGFRPSAGRLIAFELPQGPGVRIDSGFARGDLVPGEFDSMLAKIVVTGATREEALARLEEALSRTTVAIEGGASNRSLLIELARNEEFHGTRRPLPAYAQSSAGRGLVARRGADGTRRPLPDTETTEPDTSVSGYRRDTGKPGHSRVRLQPTTRWLDRYLAERPKGESRPNLEVALVAAAVGEHERARREEIAEFFKRAQRGLPPDAPRQQARAFRFGLDGAPVSVEVRAVAPERYRLACGEATVDARYRATGRATAAVTVGGRRFHVVQVETPSAWYLEIDGIAHRLSRASDGRVVAPVPAAVTEVCVKEGDEVRPGDRLFTLEVMKMEVPIAAPAGGRVGRVFVERASRVSAGQALAMIELGVGKERPTTSPIRPIRPIGPTAWRREAHAPAERESAASGVLEGAMLGYDFDEGQVDGALEKIRAGEAALSPAELSRLLDQYVSHERLFATAPGSDGIAPVDHFATHLRRPRARGEGLPEAFTTMLRDALAWYRVEGLAPSPAQDCALVRIVQAHRANDLRGRILASVLAGSVRDDGIGPIGRIGPIGPIDVGVGRTALRDRLESFAALVIRRDRALAEPAYTAIYLLCDRPRQLAEARELGEAAAELFDRSAAKSRAGDRETASAALEELPHGALLSLIGRVLGRDLATRERLVDLLVQRLHPEAERASSSDEAAGAARYWTRAGTLLSLLSTARDAAEDLRCALGSDGNAPTHIDLFLPEPGAEIASLEDAGRFDFVPAAVRRLSLNWGNVERGRLSRTFERSAEGAFQENRFLRDLHPARIEAAEVARWGAFDLQRLPAPGEVFLALAKARQDPTDERLVCIVEVERVDPERDSHGRLVRIPSFERVFMTALHAMRDALQAHPSRRPHWNRLVVFVRPVLTQSPEEIESMARRLTPATIGLGLEKFVLRGRVAGHGSPAGRPVLFEWANPMGHGTRLTLTEPGSTPVRALTADERRVVEAHRRGLFYPYELIRSLASEEGANSFPPGSFIELDLAPDGESLVEVSRPFGQNAAQLVVGRIVNRFPPFPDGLARVLIVGDPTRGMGSLAEPECRRIVAAIDLAERERLAVEWVPVSSGARIAMDSGTENLDWTARVLARIVRFTQAGGVINIVLDGVNVGAQSYWNAEATMLGHCKGTLVMTPQGSMLLTGKKALEFAGSVSAEDNAGIGGFERIMGPNGEAQYFAPDLRSAYSLLFRHLALTAIAPGETRPRRQETSDSDARDATAAPYADAANGFGAVGAIFDERTNPGRKKPFSIREVMRAVVDQDVEPLERWERWQGAESAVVWHASLGGEPVCCIGIESRPVPRRGEVPADGPDCWTSGTLFPLSSKKVARAINASSGVEPVVVLANLSGFDGSPDSLRHLQLEYGAEIGRAVVNFSGPIVFCVVARYHGGAYVVFSRALNPSLDAVALQGSFASVIGGGPAAAVVFTGLVKKRAQADPAAVEARRAVDGAAVEGRAAAMMEYERVLAAATSRAQEAVAKEFDAVHTVERALQVGSLSTVIEPTRLRQEVIARIRAKQQTAEVAPPPDRQPQPAYG